MEIAIDERRCCDSWQAKVCARYIQFFLRAGCLRYGRVNSRRGTERDTMSVVKWVTRVLHGAQSCILYECRICGLTMDQRLDACRECGSREIARYELC